MVLVSDAPGMFEVKRGVPMVGPNGVKLEAILWETLRMKRSDVMLYTHAILCRPEVPGEQGRRRYELKSYMAWLRKENAQRKRFKHPVVADPFTCCAPRLLNEVKHAEAKAASGVDLVVMPMGSFALGTLSGTPGKPVSIMKYRGSVIDPTEGAQ
jgi:uracil-DNA glycosylase family 4